MNPELVEWAKKIFAIPGATYDTLSGEMLKAGYTRLDIDTVYAEIARLDLAHPPPFAPAAAQPAQTTQPEPAQPRAPASTTNTPTSATAQSISIMYGQPVPMGAVPTDPNVPPTEAAEVPVIIYEDALPEKRSYVGLMVFTVILLLLCGGAGGAYYYADHNRTSDFTKTINDFFIAQLLAPPFPVPGVIYDDTSPIVPSPSLANPSATASTTTGALATSTPPSTKVTGEKAKSLQLH